MSNGPILYPNVTSLPGQSGINTTDLREGKKNGGTAEFHQVFERALESADGSSDLSKIRSPLKFSAHATQRLKDRKIAFDPLTMAKVNDAVSKAEAKGIEDTLILTPEAALIVSVKNRTVVTALDRASLSGNVFTNIDGAVVI